jgi:hypothetical protein
MGGTAAGRIVAKRLRGRAALAVREAGSELPQPGQGSHGYIVRHGRGP